MRIGYITGIAALAFFAVSCGSASNNETASNQEGTEVEESASTEKPMEEGQEASPSMFGEEITIEEVTSSEDLFAQLAEKDTIENIVVSGEINSCCQKKGCWMKVDLGNEKEVFVKFKDYGFFMPLDCSGSTAVMQGKAYAETVSVDELKHYAEDAGKSEEEIAAITEPEVKYSFMADGVILKDYVRNESEASEETPAEEPTEEQTEE